MSHVIVVGGNINGTLKKWLAQLNIHEFTHYEIHVESISKEQLVEVANRLYTSIPLTAMVLSVGTLADRVLNLCWVLHGTLPDTRTKDKKRITLALVHCRNYLTLRRFYGQFPSDPTNKQPS